MDCKEQLLQFFLQDINLSQYDQKFLSNLQLIVHRDNRITSNQSDLFDKLVEKYNRQLSKYGLVKEALKELKWQASVVVSSPEFTGAKISLDDDKIVLKVPFNKTFIAKFREIPSNPFEWQRDERVYTAPYSTYGLKILKENLHKYFFIVHICNQVEAILLKLKEYEAEIWDPTLVKINDRLVILAINPILGDIVKDIELNADAKTMFKLSRLGIKIHPSLIVDSKTKFASEFITEVDIDDVPTVVEWFAELGVTHILMGKGLTMNNSSVRRSVVSAIEKCRGDIPIDEEIPPLVFQYHTNPDTRAYYSTDAISKCVIIKNSRPIEVK